MSNGLDSVAGPENYTPDTSAPGWTDNGGNYGTTPAPEGDTIASPQGETDFTAGPGPAVPDQIAGRLGGDSFAPMPTPDN